MRPTALLVEDEPDLLQVLTLALGRALPDVDLRVADTIAHGADVMDEVARAGGTVVLVIADHKIAGEGRTGLSLLQQVHGLFPEAASFLFTGQAAPDVEDQARAIGARVLWKPLRLSALVAEVQGALAR